MGSIFTEMVKTERTLAIHPGAIKERLVAACLDGLIRVSDESLSQLPADVASDFRTLYSELTSNDDIRDGEGRIHATVRIMCEEDAVKIASKIKSLAYQVSQIS